MKGTGKMMLILLMAAAAVLAAAWGIGLLREYRRLSSYVPYSGTIKRTYFSTGGGMDGGSLEITAENTDKGYILVRMEEKKTWNAKTVKRTVKADPALFREIEELVISFGVKDWGDLPDSEFIALDAPTVSAGIDFTDGTYRSFYSYQVFPEGCDGFIRAVRELLEKYTTGL